MCDQNDIPEDIEEVIHDVEDLMSDATYLSQRIDIQVDVCSMLTNDPDLVRTWANIGDYEPHLEGEDIKWNYRPKVLKDGGYDTSLYQDDIDPARIVSFTMPPKDGEQP